MVAAKGSIPCCGDLAAQGPSKELLYGPVLHNVSGLQTARMTRRHTEEDLVAAGGAEKDRE